MATRKFHMPHTARIAACAIFQLDSAGRQLLGRVSEDELEITVCMYFILQKLDHADNNWFTTVFFPI